MAEIIENAITKFSTTFIERRKKLIAKIKKHNKQVLQEIKEIVADKSNEYFILFYLIAKELQINVRKNVMSEEFMKSELKKLKKKYNLNTK